MKIDNPLSREFLQSYPYEAARILEQVSPEDVAAFLMGLSPQVSTPVITAMLPRTAAACLSFMEMQPAVEMVAELSIPAYARIYRLLKSEKQDELIKYLPEKKRSKLHRFLQYSSDSVGSIIDANFNLLPEDITVSEAIRRIGDFNRPVRNEIYIENNHHQLVGLTDMASLLTSSHHSRLMDIMDRKTYSIAVRATAESLLSHPGWEIYQRLPVVERDNNLVGVLHNKAMKESLGEIGTTVHRDPLENLLSVAGTYWLTMAHLLDSILSIEERRRGGQL